MFGGAKGGTAIQSSTVVQDQLKILYGVCIDRAFMRACKHTIYINFESALYLCVLVTEMKNIMNYCNDLIIML